MTAKFEALGPTATPSATVANVGLSEPGASVTSPVTGAVVRWTVIDSEGPLSLSVLHAAGGISFTASSTSALTTVSGLGRQTFSTDLPIQTGDTIGLNVVSGDGFGHAEKEGLGSSVAIFAPAIPTGSTATPLGFVPESEFAFNAEVQPAPMISALSTASGPIKGGTTVTIAGTDFEGASAVSFGSTPAQSFTVSSEGLIAAVAPSSKTLAEVPVTVTTIAGTANSPTTFAYTGCKVPSLAGKKLKAAKKGLRKNDCKLGKVIKKDGATAKTGKVVKQGPKAGKILAAGTKVKVTLG